MRRLEAIKARIAAGNEAFRFGRLGGVGRATGDPYGGWLRTLSGSSFDYEREVGIKWENSIVAGGVRWAVRNFKRGRIVVQRPTGKKLDTGEPEYEEVVGHPLSELFNRPNPHYSRGTMLSGLVLSRMTEGDSYLYVNRNAIGRPVELYYVPHFQIEPQWGQSPPTFPGESSDYVDHWLYAVPGEAERQWKPRDVFHWRDGIDPLNLRKGLAPLKSALREISADNCASVMGASLLRNNNVPGLVISAKVGKDGGSSFDGLTSDQEDKIREMARTKWSGDRAGELAIIPAPVDVSRMSFSPKEMDLGPLRDLNEERILAQWGIPLAVAGFGSGLEQTKVGATMTSMIELAWDQCVIPMQDDLADDLTEWGAIEFKPLWEKGMRVVFDRSQVPALQEDEDALHSRTREDWQAGLTKRSEARRRLRLPVDEKSDDVYVTEVQGSATTTQEDDDEELGRKAREIKALAVRRAQGRP